MKQRNCWLNNFNLEYVNADFQHKGKRIHKKKVKTRKVISTGEKRKFDVGRKDCQDMNNARNKDSFAITKSNNILEYDERQIELGSQRQNSSNHGTVEDTAIAMIDLKDKLLRLKKLEES